MKKAHPPKSKTLTARKLRLILSVATVVIIISAAAGFTYGLGIIRDFATTVSHAKIDADASANNLQAYQKLQDSLQKYQPVREKAKQLRVTSDFPEFKIVGEVQSIAAANNLSIDDFSYGNSSSSEGASSAPAAGGSQAPATNTPATESGSTPPAASSGKTFSLTVNFSGPVNYQRFLQFLYDTEQHIPKLQVKGINLSPGGGSSSGGTEGSTSSGPVDPSKVTVDKLTVEMYIN